MKPRLVLRYCLLHLSRDWLRGLMAVISISVILSVFFLSGGLIRDLENLAESRFVLPANLITFMSSNAVFPGDSHISTSDLVYYAELIDENIGKGTAQHQIPMIYRQVYLNEDAILVVGLDYQDLLELGRLELVEGQFPAQKDQVLVNQEYQLVAGRNVGDRVTIYGRSMVVSGICVSSLWHNSAILLSFSQAVELYNSQGEFQIGAITLSPGTDPIKVQDLLKDKPRSSNCCNIYLHDHYTALTQNALRGFHTISHIVRIVVMLLLTFGAYNTSALLISEHYREVVLLRVIGFSERQVSFFVFLRTFFIMFVSYILGFLAAQVISIIQMAEYGYSISGVLVKLRPNLEDMLIVFVMVILLTALGTYLSLHKRDPLKRWNDLTLAFQGKVG